MSLLSRYLTRLFFREALALFAVAVILVWITQTLRLFDLVTAKGQDMLTLLGQASLTTPPLARAILCVCMGIGMVRALRALQNSRELHAIHVSKRFHTLFTATAAFAFAGMIFISAVAHWIDPLTKRAYAAWSEQVAADLVGRALNPHRFSEVVPGLILVIGGREADGSVTDFFADDTRDDRNRRTYIAKKAVIVPDEEGYNISLTDGAVQYVNREGRFTEVQFSRYNIGLGRFAETGSTATGLDEIDSLALLARGLDDQSVRQQFNERLAETARIAALCLFVLALAGFPSARRGRSLFPPEMIVLIAGLAERVVSIFAGSGGPLAPYSGAMLLTAAGGFILLVRLRGFASGFPKGRPA